MVQRTLVKFILNWRCNRLVHKFQAISSKGEYATHLHVILHDKMTDIGPLDIAGDQECMRITRSNCLRLISFDTLQGMKEIAAAHDKKNTPKLVKALRDLLRRILHLE